MSEKKKRYYIKGEVIWSLTHKERCIVESVNTDNLTLTVKLSGRDELFVDKIWKFDKIKFSAKENLIMEENAKMDKKVKDREHQLLRAVEDIEAIMYPRIFFAKIKPDTIIPSKRDEDAGYDFYANFDSDFLICPANRTTFVPTGLATALPKTHYFNVKHERGSTAKLSMSVLAGVVDSGFRNEIFIAITPLSKDIVIYKEGYDLSGLIDCAFYSYSKAIAQATLDIVPKPEVIEISYEELQNIESERKMTMLGESGK